MVSSNWILIKEQITSQEVTQEATISKIETVQNDP